MSSQTASGIQTPKRSGFSPPGNKQDGATLRRLSPPSLVAGVQPGSPCLRKSTSLQVFDIPIDQLLDSENNPNEQDEATFDQLVAGIKADGFDEPVIVVPQTALNQATGQSVETGKYIIVSGHHRKKAAAALKFTHVPCVIKSGWDEDKKDVELVRRNMLKGKLNPEKFTALFQKLSMKGIDQAVLKLQMGFTKSDAFDKLYRAVESNLPASQKKKLAEAKETIKSVDGLSSVLNSIFTEHGSDLDHGFVVFSFGGKDHIYIECDSALHKMMRNLTDDVRAKGGNATEVMKQLVGKPVPGTIKPSVATAERKAIRRAK